MYDPHEEAHNGDIEPPPHLEDRLPGPFPRQTTDREFIEGLTELEIRMIAHEIHVCRDCTGPTPEGPLDKFGRCDDCADEIQRQVEAAESAAGWDPNP